MIPTEKKEPRYMVGKAPTGHCSYFFQLASSVPWEFGYALWSPNSPNYIVFIPATAGLFSQKPTSLSLSPSTFLPVSLRSTSPCDRPIDKPLISTEASPSLASLSNSIFVDYTLGGKGWLY
ncbi:hypothetical protein BU23DRAFT_566176 [Bimuria novae-zelandiae CBS 107.79]|uniref:Uncharacterized protein n=1 Tax=Bimuria novae-zelandiae CBS 107.79 TaxID=1447943 RepID=A0A6A5VRU1_9PLEO|nr:hypothetical protein BU23DRAFT_566176 [Bimuria novae-zelandiae CBS 107.79]